MLIGIKSRLSFLFSTLLLGALALLPSGVSAYEMAIAGSDQEVSEPAVQKWYFGELAGTPDVYRIESDVFFVLDMRLLVPERLNSGERYGAQVFWVDAHGREPIVALEGGDGEWAPVTEKYSGEKYLGGPEFSRRMAPGDYEIEVGGNDNYGKYVLVMGGRDSGGLGAAFEAVRGVPRVMSEYYGESPVRFLTSRFAQLYVIVAVLAGYVLGLLWFAFLKTADYRTDRICLGDSKAKAVVRIGLSALLIGWAVSSSWNPTLFLLAGLLLFDATRRGCRFSPAAGSGK